MGEGRGGTPGKRISVRSDAEAWEVCCTGPVQLASVGLLGRAGQRPGQAQGRQAQVMEGFGVQLRAL